MTTFRPGRLSACVLAQYLLSPLLTQADHSWLLAPSETTHFGSTAKEFIAGEQSGTMALTGLYDGTPVPGASTNVSADNIINSLVGTPADVTAVLFMDGGMAVGRKVHALSGKITNYTPAAPIGGVETMKVDLQHNGPIGDGLCLVDGSLVAGAPVLTLGSASAGGTFAAGTYFWKLTFSTALGETLASSEVTATLTLNQQQAFTAGTAPAGATTATLYRGTAMNGENVKQTFAVTPGQTVSITDTGAAGTAGTPPTSAGFWSSIDNAASSSNGGTAYFNLVANTNSAPVTVKVQHSADNITWTDLAVSTAFAANTTGYQTVAVSGTVNRYIRAIVVETGTGSAQAIVAFIRN